MYRVRYNRLSETLLETPKGIRIKKPDNTDAVIKIRLDLSEPKTLYVVSVVDDSILYSKYGNSLEALQKAANDFLVDRGVLKKENRKKKRERQIEIALEGKL